MLVLADSFVISPSITIYVVMTPHRLPLQPLQEEVLAGMVMVMVVRPQMLYFGSQIVWQSITLEIPTSLTITIARSVR